MVRIAFQTYTLPKVAVTLAASCYFRPEARPSIVFLGRLLDGRARRAASQDWRICGIGRPVWTRYLNGRAVRAGRTSIAAERITRFC
jgi:hypothetical protein